MRLYKAYIILCFNGLGRTYKPLGHKRELRGFHAANKVVKYLNNKGVDCYASVIKSTVKPIK